jgi:Tfp pilus assembly protein PilZ
VTTQDDVNPGQENGHVRVGANKAFALAGSILLLIATWAVGDHVKTVGRVTTVEAQRAQDRGQINDHETRVRELEKARAQEAERDAAIERIERMIREDRERRKR